MLIAYALEDRSRSFVLLFAAACAASSAYGFLAGTWPFGIVEAIWTAVALRRWVGRKASGAETPVRSPIACDMMALSTAERHRYDSLRPRVLKAIDDVQEHRLGFVSVSATPRRLQTPLIGSRWNIAVVPFWTSTFHSRPT